MSVYIGFSRPRSWYNILSYLIRIVERTDYSHVYIRYEDQWLVRRFYYEAHGLNVHFTTESQWIDLAPIVTDVFFIEATKEQEKRVLQFCFDNVGKNYYFLTLIGIAIVLFLKMFWIKIKNPIRAGKSGEICSKIVAQMLEEVFGVRVCDDLEAVKPVDVYKALEGMSIARRVHA